MKYPEVEYTYKGVQLPAEMWVWDDDEKKREKRLVYAIIPSHRFPVKATDEHESFFGFSNAAPIIQEPTPEQWAALPAWANWWAVDEDGFQRAYYDEPNQGNNNWFGVGAIYIPKECYFEFTGDWRQAKFKRPENV